MDEESTGRVFGEVFLHFEVISSAVPVFISKIVMSFGCLIPD
jgi:hypothetical protein